MVADGKIGDDEAEIYREILDQGARTVKAYYEMKFSRKE